MCVWHGGGRKQRRRAEADAERGGGAAAGAKTGRINEGEGKRGKKEASGDGMVAVAARIFLAKFRVRTGGPQGNQMHIMNI